MKQLTIHKCKIAKKYFSMLISDELNSNLFYKMITVIYENTTDSNETMILCNNKKRETENIPFLMHDWFYPCL